MSAIRIIESEILSDQKLRLEKISYEHPNRKGEMEAHTREIVRRSPCTTILLYDEERKTILLTEQLRVPVFLNENKSEHLLEACAGIMDKGEYPEECVIREVEEETGYRISHIKRVAEAYSSPGFSTEYVYYFTGEYTPEVKVAEGGGLDTEGEDIKNVELSYEKAKELLLTGKIRDAKTMVLLQYAIIHNIL